MNNDWIFPSFQVNTSYIHSIFSPLLLFSRALKSHFYKCLADSTEIHFGYLYDRSHELFGCGTIQEFNTFLYPDSPVAKSEFSVLPLALQFNPNFFYPRVPLQFLNCIRLGFYLIFQIKNRLINDCSIRFSRIVHQSASNSFSLPFLKTLT